MTQKAEHTPGPWSVEKWKKLDGEDITQVSAFSKDGNRTMQAVVNSANNEANARLIAAAPKLLDSHEPERGGADFLDWVADRLVNVYGESENVDFVICLRRRAAKAREAISQAIGV